MLQHRRTARFRCRAHPSLIEMQDPHLPGWLTTLELLGAAQGLFLGALLAGSRSNRTANRVLAVAMVAFSVDLFAAWAYAEGLDQRWPHLVGIDFLLPFLYGPVIYVYALSLTLGGTRLPRGGWMHFLPLVFAALGFLPFYAQSAAAKIALRMAPETHPWTPWLQATNYVKLAYGLAYLVIVLRLLRRHDRTVHETYSSDLRVGLHWLRNVVLGGLAMWTLSAVMFAFGWITGEGDVLQGLGDVVPVALAVYVYAIGYLGLRQGAMPRATTDVRQTGRPYARSGLDAERAAALVERLERLMEEERLYRDPDLSLADLASRAGASPQHCSEALNRGRGGSFYSFVNAYRVRDVQQRMMDPESEALTVLALAEDAGFASKSAFNAAFRRETGMTPSAWRRLRRSKG